MTGRSGYGEPDWLHKRHPRSGIGSAFHAAKALVRSARRLLRCASRPSCGGAGTLRGSGRRDPCANRAREASQRRTTAVSKWSVMRGAALFLRSSEVEARPPLGRSASVEEARIGPPLTSLSTAQISVRSRWGNRVAPAWLAGAIDCVWALSPIWRYVGKSLARRAKAGVSHGCWECSLLFLEKVDFLPRVAGRVDA
jgi:hypothetical protein